MSPCAALLMALFSAPGMAQQAQPLSLTSIDLETTMMVVQGERTKLLDQQLNQQLKEVQARNEKIAKLNSDLSGLIAQRAKLGSGAANEAKASKLDMQIAGLKQQIDQLSGAGKIDFERLKEMTSKQNEATELLKKLQEKQEQELTQKKTLQPELTEKVTTEMKPQEKTAPGMPLTQTEEKKGPATTLTLTKEKTEPSIKQAQEVTPKSDELQLQQQIKQVREKLMDLKNDPEQKKQLEQKLVELTKLQQQKLQEKSGPGTTLTQTEEKKGPALTLTQTKEKTEPAVKKTQELTQQQYELQLKQLQEKIKQLKNDPEQKLQLEQKQLELVELQQKIQKEKTSTEVMQQEKKSPGTILTQTQEKKSPETTLTQTQEKIAPDVKTKLETLQASGALSPAKPDAATEMTREGLKEILSQPAGQLSQPFSPVPGTTVLGDATVAPLELQTIKPIERPAAGSTFPPGGDMSQKEMLALLDQLGQTLERSDSQALQTAQVAALLQIPGGIVGGASATAAGIAGSQAWTAAQAALDLARQVAAASSAAEAATDAFPYITAGSVLARSSWPTAMVATYNGRISGTLNDGASIGGNINMTVNFNQLQTAGNPAVPGSVTFDKGMGGMSFNLVRFGSFIGNSASGTYNGQPVTGAIMNGQFYGPQAQEVGGQWNMQNTGATVTASGNFAAKQ